MLRSFTEIQSDLFWNIYLFHMAFKATGLFLVLMLQKVDSNFFGGGGSIHKAEAQERFRSKESLWNRNEQTVKESWKNCKKKLLNLESQTQGSIWRLN